MCLIRMMRNITFCLIVQVISRPINDHHCLSQSASFRLKPTEPHQLEKKEQGKRRFHLSLLTDPNSESRCAFWSTYNCCWSCSQHTVEDQRGDEAFILCSWIRFHQISILAKEALDVHLERVCALEVVGKQYGPGHNDELKIQHGCTETLAAVQQLCLQDTLQWAPSIIATAPTAILMSGST